VLNALAQTPATGKAAPVVLADSPGYQRRFLPVGITVVPPWSPQADWLFDRRLPPDEALRLWRQSGVTHLIITKWKMNLDYFNAHSRWALPPFHVQQVGETSLTSIFAIRGVE
jgi:hypothetical protein